MLRHLRICLAALALAAVPPLTLLPWPPRSADAAVASPAAPFKVGCGCSFWSGYIAYNPPATAFGYGLQGPTDFGWGSSASWVQPAATCTATDTAANFWVGLGNTALAPVWRVGTDTDCSGGSPKYYAWYGTSTFSANSGVVPQVTFGGTVSAGDSITAGVTCFNGGCIFQVVDYTANWTAVYSAAYSSTPTSSEVMVSRPQSGLVPLTNFGTVTFNTISFGAAAASAFNPQQIPAITNSAGTSLDSTSALGGGASAGASFSATWLGAS